MFGNWEGNSLVVPQRLTCFLEVLVLRPHVEVGNTSLSCERICQAGKEHKSNKKTRDLIQVIRTQPRIFRRFFSPTGETFKACKPESLTNQALAVRASSCYRTALEWQLNLHDMRSAGFRASKLRAAIRGLRLPAWLHGSLANDGKSTNVCPWCHKVCPFWAPNPKKMM